MYMFFIKKWFYNYNTQEINKLLVQSAYNDYNKVIQNYTNKYPNFKGSYTIIEYSNLDKKTKVEWNEYIEKMSNSKQILIYNLLNYCKNYPNEKISKNKFIDEYTEYSYRLEQNIDEIILEL